MGVWLASARDGVLYSVICLLFLYKDTACTSRFEITDVLVHGTEGRTGSDASPLHRAARTGTPLRLHGVARMYGCCLTANRTSILQQNLSHRDPNEPGSARSAVRELHGSTDLHGMPDLDHCTELHGTHAAALQASRGCTSLHGSFLRCHILDVYMWRRPACQNNGAQVLCKLNIAQVLAKRNSKTELLITKTIYHI